MRNRDVPDPALGEVAIVLDGQTRIMCLTLGALGELEARLAAGDLAGLAERVSSGRVSVRAMIAIIGAALRGGGNAISDDDLSRMSVDGGMIGIRDKVQELWRLTIGEVAS